MSLLIDVTIQCDICCAQKKWEGIPDLTKLFGLKAEGWSRAYYSEGHIRDFCPACVEAQAKHERTVVSERM